MNQVSPGVALTFPQVDTYSIEKILFHKSTLLSVFAQHLDDFILKMVWGKIKWNWCREKYNSKTKQFVGKFI